MKPAVASLFILLASGSSIAQPTHTDVTPVTAEIRESIMPVARGQKYGQPLDSFLKDKELGEVTGGGTSVDTNGMPSYIEISFDLRDPEQNAPAVAEKLKELGAPLGSSLHYRIGDQMRTIPVR